jgi:hypothetical protein
MGTPKNSAKKAPAKKPAAKKAPAKKPAAKKASTKKATAKKTPTKKAPAKKSAAKKTTAKKAPAKKSAVKKTTAKKTPTKKAPAKKPANTNGDTNKKKRNPRKTKKVQPHPDVFLPQSQRPGNWVGLEERVLDAKPDRDGHLTPAEIERNLIEQAKVNERSRIIKELRRNGLL